MDILIIDDNERYLQYMVKQLNVGNHRIMTETDFKKAIERCRVEEYDAVIIDLVMNGINGIELLRRIKSHNRIKSTLFIVTNSYSTEQHDEVRRYGGLAVSEKYLTAETFNRLIGPKISGRE
ncbi:MAG: response regulator [Spirochaetota bacterium]